MKTDAKCEDLENAVWHDRNHAGAWLSQPQHSTLANSRLFFPALPLQSFPLRLGQPRSEIFANADLAGLCWEGPKRLTFCEAPRCPRPLR